jgi:DNA modification methylase
MGQILIADALSGLKTLKDKSANICVTSPPYYNLRDYGIDGQIGTETSPEEYISKLVEVFHEVKRVLADDGTLWIVIADCYAGSGKGRNANGEFNIKTAVSKQRTNTGSCSGTLTKTQANGCKPKDLIGIPWLLAFALRDNGWYLRSDIIWEKPNAFPESVKDRCTKSYEHVFMLSKSKNYYYDADAIREPVQDVSLKRSKYGWHGKGDNGNGSYAGFGGCDEMGERMVNPAGRNKRDVWHVNTASYREAHFATYPPELIRPCILAGTKKGGVVLDPFIGSGTTALVALQEGRDYIGIEIQSEYKPLIEQRLSVLLPKTTCYFSRLE